MRNGTGEPTLCRPHRIVAEHEARQQDRKSHSPVRTAGTVVGEIFDDFISGRPFDSAKVTSAINDFAWNMGGGYAPFHPNITNDAPDPRRAATGNQRSTSRPPPSWFPDDQPAAPRPDFDIQNARRELGFGPGDVLTIDTIKDRRRHLARKHHPDRGGSTFRMQIVNDSADTLLEFLAEPSGVRVAK
jgi:hypothetical protein